ncbi:MAG: hypothetical protein K8M05_41810 [Deltaproteobacteria bacterium]|nr:hypothetical protein [Kofleriaceae bacterium]
MSRLALALFVLAATAACTASDDDGEPAADAAVSVDAALPVDARVIDAPAGTTCAVKEPIVQLIYTCQFAWRQCTGGADRMLDCQITAVGSLRFSLCSCMVGGQTTTQFTSETVCGSTAWSQVEAIVNTQCGWDLR